MSIKVLSVKQSGNIILCLALAVFALLLPARVIADSTELRDARRTFEKEYNKISRDFTQEQQVPLNQYEADLMKVLNFMKKKEDEYGTRPTEQEVERFKKERTVPTEATQGLPKLIQQARDRYAENFKPVKTKHDQRMTSLLDNYFKKLASLELSMDASGNTGGAEEVRKEVERVKERFGTGSPKKDPKDDFSVITVKSTLSGDYLKGLGLMYVMKARAPFRLRDMSVTGRHGRIIGASVNDKDPDTLSFLNFHEIIELEKPFEPKFPGWTIIAEVKFPLQREGNQRILAAGVFRKNHITVDQTGMLGMEVYAFKSCGYDTRKLEGWHRIATVANKQNGQTAFYVDGQPAGVLQAICEEPINAIGNCTAYGKPWGGGINAVLAWNRMLAPEEIQQLPKTLIK